jgi:hypothetical protein
MCIVRDDETHLVTVDFSWLTALGFLGCGSAAAYQLASDQSSRWHIFFAVAILFVGLLGANQFARRIVFDFDKSAQQLAWSCTSLLGRRCRVVPFKEIKSAGVHFHRDGKMRMYRIEVHTDQGMLPMSNAFSTADKDELEAIASRINVIVGGVTS